MFSIIIPTYNERKNLIKLVNEIEKQNLPSHEIIVVDDDSQDGTQKAAHQLAKKYGNIRLIKRPRKMGAASAILDGFKVAKGSIIGAMDADGSHPAQLLPKLFKQFPEKDFVIASRYIARGGTRGWPLWRKIISRGATLLAKPITKIKDPMSGYFFLKKDIISGLDLKTTSCKICLEILAKGRYQNVKEIPFIFKDRWFGNTKMTKMHFLDYLKHVLKLYFYSFKKALKKYYGK